MISLEISDFQVKSPRFDAAQSREYGRGDGGKVGFSDAVDFVAGALVRFVSSAQDAASRSLVVALLSCNSASARRAPISTSVERRTIKSVLSKYHLTSI